MNIDSLIFLAKLCPSLPIIWKLLWLVDGLYAYCADKWVRNASGALCIFHQRSWRFATCIHLHMRGHHIGTNIWPTFADHRVLVLGGD